MDKRTLIAFLLIGIIFLVWMSMNRNVAVQSLQQPGITDTTVYPETLISIENNNQFKAMLSSKGGGTLIGWSPKNNPEDSAGFGLPVNNDNNHPPQWATDNLAVSLNNQVLNPDAFTLVQDITDKQKIRTLKFRYSQDSLLVQKTFIIRPNSHQLDLRVQVVDSAQLNPDNRANYKQLALHWNSGLDMSLSDNQDEAYFYQASAFQKDGLLKIKNGENGISNLSETHWVAFNKKHLLMAIIPDQPGKKTELYSDRINQWKIYRSIITMPIKTDAAYTYNFKVFLGPRSNRLLDQTHPALDDYLGFGWADRETIIPIENRYFKAKLSSMGGGSVISWELTEKSEEDTSEYRYKNDPTTNHPVQLLPKSAGGNLAISTDTNLDMGLVNFKSVPDSHDIQGNRYIRFRHTIDPSDKNSTQVEKTFIIKPDVRDMEMTVRFINSLSWKDIRSQYTVNWPTGLDSTESDEKDYLRYAESIALKSDDNTNKQNKKGSTGIKEVGTKWVSTRTKYFLMALIPQQTGAGYELTVAEENSWKAAKASLAMTLSRSNDQSQTFTVFLGPMDYQVLKSYNNGLEKSMSFGWRLFKPLSIGALYVLQFFYNIFKNYGWAIIVFGILIKLLLYPLTRHSYKSMKEMQALQPKMTALREKYKNDPKKLNEETMKLYKEHGVNPMSGCLPMLLQMPFLIALFNLFRTTIMLRHADFYFIKDLSAPDHLLSNIPVVGFINILPILLGLAMILQQKLSSTQNTQQKAMTFIMPIFLTFIFYKFSAGLNLYYLVFNLFTIAQEIIVKRTKKEGPEPA